MSVPINGNVPKAKAYRLAWERIEKSIESDYPLEAIAIEESILSDRLNSFRGSFGEETRLTDTLEYIIKGLRKQFIQSDSEEDKLLKRVLRWYSRRCKCIHGIVRSKSHKFTIDAQAASPKVPAHQFYDMARRCAEDGMKLAREVCEWSSKRIRMAKRVSNNTKIRGAL